jgi:hypothetical protein
MYIFNGSKINNPIPGMGDGVDPLIKLLNIGLQMIWYVAGIWALVNFLIAGFKYLTASGDSKKVSEANYKMTMTVVGLAIIIATPIIAAILGQVFYGDPTAILSPKFKGV